MFKFVRAADRATVADRMPASRLVGSRQAPTHSRCNEPLIMVVLLIVVLLASCSFARVCAGLR